MAKKGAVDDVMRLQKQIVDAKLDIGKTEQDSDLEKEAEPTYGTMPDVEARLEAALQSEEKKTMARVTTRAMAMGRHHRNKLSLSCQGGLALFE